MFDLEILPKQAGNYVIVGYSPLPFNLEMKRFGRMELPAGYYLYCGSAHGPGGLRSRVQRHLDAHTKKFWHFDHIKGHLNPIRVWWQSSPVNFECETAQFLLTLPGAECLVRGFGASDCRKGCPSHLVYFPELSLVERVWKEINLKDWLYRQINTEAQ